MCLCLFTMQSLLLYKAGTICKWLRNSVCVCTHADKHIYAPKVSVVLSKSLCVCLYMIVGASTFFKHINLGLMDRSCPVHVGLFWERYSRDSLSDTSLSISLPLKPTRYPRQKNHPTCLIYSQFHFPPSLKSKTFSFGITTNLFGQLIATWCKAARK